VTFYDSWESLGKGIGKKKEFRAVKLESFFLTKSIKSVILILDRQACLPTQFKKNIPL